jgi:hypothetical protein
LRLSLKIIKRKIQCKDFGGMKKGDVRWANPSTEQFGRYGWHYVDLERARPRLNELIIAHRTAGLVNS